MNVKFKMPKFGRILTGGSMMKELLLTILGTTISIVLTFGTAHFVEQRQAEQARRLMAMTIINDIDESIKTVQKIMKEEEREHNITLYLMENIDRLDSISEDTLDVFADYITPTSYHESLGFKKNNENIFNSSQDSWRTLNDRQFLKNVQNFYNDRADFEQRCKEEPFFQTPITREEEYQLLMKSDELWGHDAYVAWCRKMLKSIQLKCYTDYSRQRMHFYNYFLKRAINLNEENKFLMNITEQELEDFMNETYMTVRSLKEKNIVGIWETVMPNNDFQENFEFHKDHTVTTHYVEYFDCYNLGKMILRYSMTGTWAVEGDSLVMDFNMKSYKHEIDENGVTYTPDRAYDVALAKKRIVDKLDFVKRLEKNSRVAQSTNIDESGTRLELTNPDTGVPAHYRKRK